MTEISYLQMVLTVSMIWIFVRGICWAKEKEIRWKRDPSLSPPSLSPSYALLSPLLLLP